MLTLSVPPGSSSAERAPATAVCSEASGPSTWRRNRSPSSVRARRRVLRLEQAHGEAGLEARDVLADARRRQAEDARRGREAAVLGRLHEREQVLDVGHAKDLKPPVEDDSKLQA
jgi:hypothetical protein